MFLPQAHISSFAAGVRTPRFWLARCSVQYALLLDNNLWQWGGVKAERGNTSWCRGQICKSLSPKTHTPKSGTWHLTKWGADVGRVAQAVSTRLAVCSCLVAAPTTLQGP